MSPETDSTRDRVSPTDIPIFLFIRGLALLSVLVGLGLGLHWYLGVRLLDDTHLPEPWRGGLWASLFLLYGSVFAGFIGGRLFPRRLARLAQWVGFVWMGAFGFLLAAVALSDLVLALASMVTPTEGWHRWRAVVVLGVSALALAWGFRVSDRPRLRRLELPVDGLHADLDGFKLVQLSDVHLGETLDRRFAARVVELVNGLDADAVVITGDLVDGPVGRVRDEVAPMAGLRSRHGTFFVTGNHEYYSGAASWMAECARLGMTVLHNTHRVLMRGEGRLVVAGVPDVEGGRFASAHRADADAAFAGAPRGVPRILLAHQPRFAAVAAAHQVDLMLSGHTHGGQMFPFMAFVRLQQPVIGGLHELSGVRTYTSLGTGYWGPPFRIGTRGEVTEVTLRVGPSLGRAQDLT